MLDGEPGMQQELMRFQVEIATRICTAPTAQSDLDNPRVDRRGAGVHLIASRCEDSKRLPGCRRSGLPESVWPSS
jgi:hypothetical protein